jgi:hypothetical protein
LKLLCLLAISGDGHAGYETITFPDKMLAFLLWLLSEQMTTLQYLVWKLWQLLTNQ